MTLEYRVIRRRCDVPMARSKRLLPCQKNCRSCVACIETDENFHERHAVHGRSFDPVLLIRNRIIRRRHDDDSKY